MHEFVETVARSADRIVAVSGVSAKETGYGFAFAVSTQDPKVLLKLIQ